MAALSFLFNTALRDSRRDRGKLVLFMSSIVLGVAALVAINSFNYNLVENIDDEAKTLLGADMVVSGNKPLSEELTVVLDDSPATARPWVFPSCSRNTLMTTTRRPYGHLQRGSLPNIKQKCFR